MTSIERARLALLRGAPPGGPVKDCSCFRIGLILSCTETGVCEYAAQWVANAIDAAVEEAIRK